MSLWPLYLALFMVLAAVGLILFVLRLRRQEAHSATVAADLDADIAGDFALAAPVQRKMAAGQTPERFADAARQAAAAEQAPPGPVCPRCRSPLVPRAAAGKEILLCSRFPRCNYGSLMK